MDSDEIKRFVDFDRCLSKIFLGVFARDELPIITKYPCSFIFNDLPKSKRGRHWLAVHFISKENVIFYDSFAFPPSDYSLKSYLKRYANKCQSNMIQHQPVDSVNCGLYCICILISLAHEQQFHKLVNNFFTSNVNENENVLEFFFKKLPHL